MILKAARTMRQIGTVSMIETMTRSWTILLAVGPFGAANMIDVIDSSAVVSRGTILLANLSGTNVAGATVSGPALLAIVKVVVDVGLINRSDGESF